MILTLPDDPALAELGETELRLDLACGLFASGRISRGVAARIAEMDRAAFDEEVFRRRIPSFTEETLAEDVKTLRTLFPE